MLNALQRLELHSLLLSLPFAAFARCMADLLTALGYRDVRLSGRTQWKGRNQSGGYDLEATLPSGLGHRRVVVQVKQFSQFQRVYQRAADELRGVALREWAGEALLLTTGLVSSAIREPLEAIIPVRLLGGTDLLDALAQCGVGVTQVKGFPIVDDAYFDRLTQQCRASRPGDLRTEKDVAPVKASLANKPLTAETVTLTLTLPLNLTALQPAPSKARAKA